MDVNRALSSKVPADPKQLKTLERITTRCAKDVEKGRYVPAKPAEMLPTQPPSALPVAPSTASPSASNFNDLNLNNITIPEPPTLQQSAPNFEQIDSAENYFDDIDANEDAEKLAQKAAADANKPLDVKIAALRDSYQGQHDRAFFTAAAKGDLRGLTAINQYLKSPDLVDANGNTPLLIAVLNGRFEAAKFLLAQKANPNAQNKAGQAALHIAVFSRRPDIVQMLIVNKANLNLAYGEGFTPLILAIMNRDEIAVQTLLIAGADVKTAMKDGNLPIHIAVAADNGKILQMLKNYGADLNVENGQGYTPLMVAAAQNKVAAASALLALGADYTRTDVYGRSAAQIAYGLGNQQIVNLVLTMQENQRR
jgi:ankyrin repeat protein